jgi:type I restriction enzyme, R subunit
MPYNEDTLVQQTTAEYLERQLGWQSVYAYNNEDIAPGSLMGRPSEHEVVLIRPLREKLVSLNPGLPDAAYDVAVRQVTATVASQTLVATNREKYTQLRDGCRSPAATSGASGCGSGCGFSISMRRKITIFSACASCG